VLAVMEGGRDWGGDGGRVGKALEWRKKKGWEGGGGEAKVEWVGVSERGGWGDGDGYWGRHWKRWVVEKSKDGGSGGECGGGGRVIV